MSKPGAEPSAAFEDLHSAEAEGLQACVFSAEGPCAGVPLTSEPPLLDAEPLTSEPPLADAAPLTSESDAAMDATGLDSFPAQYVPEP
ncbi:MULTISPECIES: hypothetical protein [unclassified Streptomyces]|uniref:hypothetical protein n=1 Tax=unclassified Streptomyces TaxID=2593676 RepID=UPI0005A69A0B|nr:MULTISPECIES: hypothetical protein [unclassified Streptomyces]WAX82011.1 hypothetical protein HUV60_022575 [Streptomyces sp. KMM 9044]